MTQGLSVSPVPTLPPAAERVPREQLDRLLAGLPVSLGSTAALGTIVLIAQWPHVPHGGAAVWYAALLAVVGWRGFLLYRSRRGASGSVAEARRWFVAGAALAGLVWGASALVLFPPDNPAAQAVLGFALGGVSAAGLATLVVDRAAAYAFLAPCLIPITLRFLLLPDAQGLAMGLMGLAYVGFVTGALERLHRVILDGLASRVLASEREEHLQERDIRLEERETRIRDLFEHTRDLIQGVAPDGRILFVNRAWCETLEYTEDEAARLNVFQVIHPDSHDHCRALLEGLWHGKSPGSVRLALKSRSGRRIEVEGDVTVRKELGVPVATRAIFHDVTARLEADVLIRESQASLERVIEGGQLGTWDWDVATGEVTWGGCWAEMLGYRPDELVGRYETWEWLVHPEDMPRTLQELQAHLAGRSPVFEREYRLRTRDGGWKWVLTRGQVVTRDAAGKPTRVSGIHADIAALKAAETEARRLNEQLSRLAEARGVALVESEERLSRLVENVSDAIIADDLEGRLVFANRRFFDLFGIEPRNVHDIVLEDYVAPEWRERLRDRHNRRVRGEDVPRQFEYEGIRPTGERLWLEVTVTRVFEQGVATGTLSAIRDITERKQTETALRVLSTELVRFGGESYLREAVARIAALAGAEAVFVGSTAGHGAPGVRLLAGWIEGVKMADRAGALEGVPWADPDGAEPELRVSADAPMCFPGAPRFEALQATALARVPLFDAQRRPIGVLGCLWRRPPVRRDHLLGILQIFATSIGAELERLRAHRQFQDLFEFAPDAILMLDEGGAITLANRQAERMFGWNRGDLVGRPMTALVAPEDRGPELLGEELARVVAARAAETGRPMALRAVRRDGGLLWCEVTLRLMDSEEGPRLAVAVRDITEQKLVQQQTFRTQRLESIGTLAGGIAHDLNNTLAPILMSTSLLREEVADGSELLEIIESSARRGTDMVRQLLGFAKGVEGEGATLDPQQVLQEIRKIVEGTFPKNVRLVIDAPERGWAIRGDPTQMHQLLLNLAVNARDAMPSGGTITLSCRNVTVDATYASSVRDASPGDYVCLEVSDTGTGMPPEVLDRIFDPFFTTKSPDRGTGLGLAVVHGIVRGHGGFLQVRSAVNVGTVFCLYLPADRESRVSDRRTPQNQVLRASGEQVLLLDDEPLVRTTTKAVLERANFRVLLAADGTEGLVLAAEHRDDLAAVLTDLNMPHLDGLGFVRALRRLLPEVPVVAVSGRRDEEALQALRELGVTVFLQKPYTQYELLSTLLGVMQGVA